MNEAETVAVYSEAEKLFKTMVQTEDDAAFYFAYPQSIDDLIGRVTTVDRSFCNGVYDSLFDLEDFTLEHNREYIAGRRCGKRLSAHVAATGNKSGLAYRAISGSGMDDDDEESSS